MGTSLLFDAQMFSVPRAFRVRVEDALAMLRKGASHQDVREIHGAVVLKEALSAQQAAADFVLQADAQINESSGYVRQSNVRKVLRRLETHS
jgi:hypothetical protein